MSTIKSSSQSHVGRFESSHKKSAKARAALDADQLWHINVDVLLAANIVLAASAKIVSLRDEIEAQIPTFELSNIDKLQTNAEALVFSNRLYLAASKPIEPLPELLARGTEFRDQLLADAKALARRNLIDPRAVADLKGGTGYVNVCSDLGVLVRLFRGSWNDIKSKSAIQDDELVEAEQISDEITLAYAERSKQTKHIAAATDDRARAYSVMFNGYDQVRRAISYVRWETNDVDDFAPSLWSGRGGRGAPEPTPEPAPEPTPGPIPAPTPANGTAATPAAPTTPVTPGMPGGSPFATS